MYDEIEKKLQTLINLQARSLVGDFETQKEKVEFLSDCGLSNLEIAGIIGASPNYVSVAKAKIKKARRDEGQRDE